MNLHNLDTQPLPPRLSMDQYADFISDNLREQDLASVAKLKDIEERMAKPFRIVTKQIVCKQSRALPFADRTGTCHWQEFSPNH